MPGLISLMMQNPAVVSLLQEEAPLPGWPMLGPDALWLCICRLAFLKHARLQMFISSSSYLGGSRNCAEGCIKAEYSASPFQSELTGCLQRSATHSLVLTPSLKAS